MIDPRHPIDHCAVPLQRIRESQYKKSIHSHIVACEIELRPHWTNQLWRVEARLVLRVAPVGVESMLISLFDRPAHSTSDQEAMSTVLQENEWESSRRPSGIFP